jgi:Protein of unknown function (DUF742)
MTEPYNPYGNEPIVDDDFGRSKFLLGMKKAAPGRPGATVGYNSDEEDASLARAFTLTGGRTAADPAIQFETMVRAGLALPEGARDHDVRIMSTVRNEPLSIAEIAVACSLPIGVVRVLVSDLVNQHFLTSSTTISNSDDALGHVNLLRRVISRVEAL